MKDFILTKEPMEVSTRVGLPRGSVRATGPVDGLTVEQRQDLHDPQTQARYWEEYRVQQRRMACPGCGEDGRSF